jgi:hypothetical protein
MNLNIEIAPENEPLLIRKAAAAGKTPVAFATEAVIRTLVEPESNRTQTNPSRGGWRAKLEEIAARHPGSGGRMDDSRESIYEGRGE